MIVYRTRIHANCQANKSILLLRRLLRENPPSPGRMTSLNLEAAGSGRRGEDVEKEIMICNSQMMINTNGLWRGENPLEYTLPILIFQSILIVLVTRTLNIALSRLRQPRFIAEVVGGIVIGPSGMGMIPNYMNILFPPRSLPVLETLAGLGLIYFMFLIGLQVDFGDVNRAGKKVWVVTAASILIPFLVAIIAFYAFDGKMDQRKNTDSYLVLICASISVTAYPVLARILAELKLLHTDIGKLAMSAAILNDGVAWVLLTVANALAGTHRSIPKSNVA